MRTPPAADAQNEDKTTVQITGHYIGERFGGGVIFWITKDGLHGLISDTIDLGKAKWSNGIYLTTGATGTAICTGRSNTKK